MINAVFMRMRDVPTGLKPKMRELTEGPIAWGLWSLTHHDGSTWALLVFDGDSSAESLIAWGACTLEYDGQPMVGVYVPPERRGRGLGRYVVSHLLNSMLVNDLIAPGGTFVASTHRWPHYFEAAKAAGLVCETWK